MTATLQTAMPFAPPPSALPPQVLPAWAPVAFRGLRRRLCQVCGWTTQEKNVDNKAHVLAHQRAEILRLRFGQGRVPAWNLIGDYLFGRAEDRILDEGGRASVQALGRCALGVIGNWLHTPTWDGLIATDELKLPSTLVWIERSTAEDLIAFLPEGKAPATRLHLARMLDLARLIESGTPSWLAAMAMNRVYAPKPVAPAWMLGQWGIDEDPDVRGRLDDTVARLGTPR